MFAITYIITVMWWLPRHWVNYANLVYIGSYFIGLIQCLKLWYNLKFIYLVTMCITRLYSINREIKFWVRSQYKDIVLPVQVSQC